MPSMAHEMAYTEARLASTDLTEIQPAEYRADVVVLRERILSEKDPERLECWLEKAAVATSVSAILDEPN